MPRALSPIAVSFLALLTIGSLLFPGRAPADDLVNEAVIDGSTDEVWKLITTKEGMESWLVPHADVDLRVGGFMRTNHAQDGRIGDPRTVTNSILAIKTKKKLSIKLVEAPQSVPLAASLVGTWYEISLSSLSKRQTRVKCVGHGFSEGPVGYAARAIMNQGSEWALQQLQKHFAARKASTAR